MSEPIVVEAGEWTTDEFLERIENGQRVIVETELFGEQRRVTLRWDGETYYCDTPMRLHKHTSAEEMRGCLRNNGYAVDATAD